MILFQWQLRLGLLGALNRSFYDSLLSRPLAVLQPMIINLPINIILILPFLSLFSFGKFPILPPSLLVLTSLLLLGSPNLQRSPALIALFQVLNPLGQDASRNLAILRPAARLLAFDDYARRQVLELHGRRRLIDLLTAWAGSLEESLGDVVFDDCGTRRQRFGTGVETGGCA